MEKKHNYRSKNRRNSVGAEACHQPLNKSRHEEEKLLNTGSSMEMFLNVCDVFEKLLNDVEINSCSKQVHDKLYCIQDAIQRKIGPFKLYKCGSDYGDLSSSISLSSSMQSLCSVTSEATLSLDDDSAFTQFLTKVNCPFCSESQKDKINLIRHLNNCKPLIFKTFKEQSFIPYSVFQILPNNSFKCNVCPSSVQKNLRTNFVHRRSSHHILAYKRLAVKKTFTEYFYCSSCRILIPDNFTQLDVHINSEVHSSKSLKAIKVDHYLKKNIHCLYMKCKKFKCLICLLQSLFSTPEEIIKHFDDTRHLKVLRQRHLSLGMIFCEVCSAEINSYELISHFTSNEHKFQEIQNVQETFELCLYCGIICENLMELAKHMRERCHEISKLRKEDLELGKEIKVRKQSTEFKKLEDVVKEKSNNDNKIPEGSTKKQNIIIVKNNTEISQLFGCFKAFGEIIGMQLFKEKNVLIEFKEKSAADKVLMLRDVIKINDLKLEITTDEELISEEKVQPKMNATQRRVSFQNPDGDHSAPEDENEDEKEVNENDDDSVNDVLNVKFQSDRFMELFQRVSNHLNNASEKFNSDLNRATIFEHYGLHFSNYYYWTLVGFSGSGLSFPVENISLYLVSFSISDHELFSTCRKLFDDINWTIVTYHQLEPVPYVEIIHKATKTVFKIIEKTSINILTDILCSYQKENDVVKPFCLMIRFWLGVKELKIREFEYVIMSLLIFFLVKEKVVKPYQYPDNHILDEAFEFEKLLDDKHKLNKDAKENGDKKNYSVQKLFLKFLHFLIIFDFDKNAICVPVKHPIPRIWMQKKHSIGVDDKNSPMFIWDPLVEVNLAQNVSETDLKSLLDTVKNTIFSTNEKF